MLKVTIGLIDVTKATNRFKNTSEYRMLHYFFSGLNLSKWNDYAIQHDNTRHRHVDNKPSVHW